MGILDNFSQEQIKQIRKELKGIESTSKATVLKDIDKKYRQGAFKKIGKKSNGCTCSYDLWNNVLETADYITKNFECKSQGRIRRPNDVRVPVDAYRATVQSLCEAIVSIWEEYGEKE